MRRRNTSSSYHEPMSDHAGLKSSSRLPDSFLSTRDNAFALGTSLNPLVCDTLVTPSGFTGFMSSTKLPMRFERYDTQRTVRIWTKCTRITNQCDANSTSAKNPCSCSEECHSTWTGTLCISGSHGQCRATLGTSSIGGMWGETRRDTAELEETKKWAHNMEAQVRALSQMMSSRARLLADARGMLQEHAGHASKTMQSVRSLKIGEMQHKTTQRGPVGITTSVSDFEYSHVVFFLLMYCVRPCRRSSLRNSFVLLT